MYKSYTLALLIIGCFLSSLSLATGETGKLTIHVTGAKASIGQVFLSLFTSSENYMKTPSLQQHLPIDANGEARFNIEDLKAGTYSVSVFYDADSNGELNTGFMRIPKEPVGFSNNAKGRFGPPGFDKTSFYFSGTQTITINLAKVK